MKKNKRISFFVIIILLAFGSDSFAQSTLQLKFTPIGIHPFNEKNSHLFENRIDANGIFVTEPCFIFSFEKFLRSDTFAWRGMFGFLSDAASKPALFLHLGVKQRLIQVWRNSLSIGIGGNLYGRESWSTIPHYETDLSWAANGKWEYKVGFMAEIEYALFLNDKNDLTLSILYGHQPNTFTFTLGYKYWISSIIKHPKKCGSCPFSKTSKHWNP
ncbi:MAG TPA: hypothetical protein PKN32_11270 [Bacteroidales bacterium]|nr:hypothetical protein [Bacteroidales bacterium]